jgi:hypothetical protein
MWDFESRGFSNAADGRFRRISPVAAHSGDRLLSEPTADTQPCRREPLFMPHTGPCPELVGALRAGKERPFTLKAAAIR